MDEVVAFARQLRGLEYDAFHAFVQSLTEAARGSEGRSRRRVPARVRRGSRR